MTRNTRIGLLAAAAAVIVAAAIIIGTGGGSDNKTDSTTAAQTAPATTSGGSTTPAVPAPAPVKVIQIKGGKPVGGVQKIVVNQGDTIHLKVQSDADHDIHVHGFDVLEHVKASGSVSFNLKAGAAGIFEVEIEETSTKIGELKVNP